MNPLQKSSARYVCRLDEASPALTISYLYKISNAKVTLRSYLLNGIMAA
jgi:hypothetical protein